MVKSKNTTENLSEENVEPVSSPTNTKKTLETFDEESNIEVLFNKLVTQFQDMQSVMKTLQSNLKLVQKEVVKQQKELKKKELKKKDKSDTKKKPSGFAKPTRISSDLENFLELPENSEIARTEVTTKIIAYVKKNELQNPENKKEILPDEKLGKLLNNGENKVTFFNLQTYLKPHFISTTTTDVTTDI